MSFAARTPKPASLAPGEAGSPLTTRSSCSWRNGSAGLSSPTTASSQRRFPAAPSHRRNLRAGADLLPEYFLQHLAHEGWRVHDVDAGGLERLHLFGGRS